MKDMEKADARIGLFWCNLGVGAVWGQAPICTFCISVEGICTLVAKALKPPKPCGNVLTRHENTKDIGRKR